MQRRRFLGRLAGLAGLAPLNGLVSAGCAGSPLAPTPATSLDVRRFGASGNGLTDDTQAFADAVRATPIDGTLDVPDGIYLIDPRRSVVLKGDMTLRLAPGAVLQALPVAEPVSAVIAVHDVANLTISGGTIVGERRQHTGTTGEWGMGIDVRGATGVTLDGVRVRDCWGDGIYVGAGRQGESRQITIRQCTSTGNRRQGLSVTACIGADVVDSAFLDTQGTVPESGIDLEPNPPYVVRDVTIRNCVAAGNAGWGILLVGDSVVACHVERSQCLANGIGGGIAVLRGPSDCVLRNNTVEGNAGPGVHLVGAMQTVVRGNTVRGNSQLSPAAWPNAWAQAGSRGTAFLDNHFVDDVAPAVSPGADILIDRTSEATRVIGNALRPRRVDPMGRVVGGVLSENPSTVVADNT